MSELNLLLTISERSKLADFISLYKEHGIDINNISLGYGTATSETLSYLGLTGSEKAVILSFTTDEIWMKLRKDLHNKLRIDIPGVGIACTVPLSSIAGRREFEYITDGLEYKEGNISEMKGTEQELIVVISNQGYSETVMDAARKAGASGGTVVHARGTGMEKAEHFLGISLASEKDIIYIVSKTNKRSEIMECIMKDAGMDTDAKAIAFSLPVTDTAGIRFPEE